MPRNVRLSELWRNQLTARIRRLYLARVFAVPVAATVILTLAIADGDRARLWVLSTVALAEFVVAVYYVTKARRAEPTVRDLLVNIAALALGGVAFVYSTGDTESPLIAVVVVPAMFVAGTWGKSAVRFMFFVPLVLFAALALAGHAGWILRFTPLFAAHPEWQTALRVTVALVASLIVWRGVAVLVDSTYQLAQRLDQTNEQLADLYDAQQQSHAAVMGGLAHELRNPLVAIKSLTELVRTDPASPRAPTHLAIVSEEIVRLESTLEATLSFAKPASPQRLQYFNLRDPLESALRILESRLGRNKTRVHVEWNDEAWLQGDEQGFRQVFFNLLSNAVEAMPTGGDVTIRFEREPAAYRIDITDTGPGLSPEVAAKLFEPYVTGKEGGTGLGLSIARQIVRGHDGELTGETLAQGGARFTLRVPFSHPEVLYAHTRR